MLNLAALQTALKNLPGYAVNRTLFKNSTSGQVEWRALVAGDLPSTITGVDYLVGTATSALSAEIVVGTTPGGELGGTWASPTVDATHSGSAHHNQVHGHADHDNRTRYVSLVPSYDVRTGTRVVLADDAHGSLGGVHIDETNNNATYKQIRYEHVVIPGDFASGMSLNFMWSSSAASNDAVFHVFAFDFADGATGNTLVLSQSLTVAAPDVANTMKLTSQAFDSAPTAGRLYEIRIDIDTNNAADTNTGTRSLWGAYLSYTADM